MNPEPGRKGMVYMGLSALSFSLMAVCVKLGAGVMPEQQLILFRSVFIIAAVLPILMRRSVPFFGNNRPLLLLRGLLGYIAMSCYFWTIGKLPVADAMSLQYMSPIFTILFATLFLKERGGIKVVLAALLCIFGMLLVVRPSGEGSVVVGLVALVGAMLAGGAYTSVRALRTTDDPYTIVLYFPLVSLPFSLVATINDWVPPVTLELWGLILGVCLFSYGGQVFLTKGLANQEASKAILVNYLSVGLGLLFGITLFDTFPTLSSAAGIALILAGVWVVSVRRRGKILPFVGEEKKSNSRG